MSRVLSYLTSTGWVCTRDALETIAEIASRENLTTEAIGRVAGEQLATESGRVRLRDGVAIVPVTGPIFRRANIFTQVSGATSSEILSRDFHAALEDDAVARIILEVDSPGGEVNGTQETAELIYQARGQKPVTTFISGFGASGAYWLASAASEVVIGETAITGSIGTALALRDFRKADEAKGIRTLDIVSSQSPKKWRDPFSDDDDEATEAQDELQVVLDTLAQSFIAAVARNRGVTPEHVIEHFGQGGLFVGHAAVEAGLADGVSTLEALISEHRTGRSAGRPFLTPAASGGPTASPKEGTMAAEDQPAREPVTREFLDEHHPDLVAQIRAEGHAEGVTAGSEAERERIEGVLAVAYAEDGTLRPTVRGFGALVSEAVADGETTKAELALRILDAREAREAKAGEEHLEALKADEGKPAPDVASPPEHENQVSAELARLKKGRALRTGQAAD